MSGEWGSSIDTDNTLAYFTGCFDVLEQSFIFVNRTNSRLCGSMGFTSPKGISFIIPLYQPVKYV